MYCSELFTLVKKNTEIILISCLNYLETFSVRMGLVSPKNKEAFKGALDKVDGSTLMHVVVYLVLATVTSMFIALNIVKTLLQPIYRF